MDFKINAIKMNRLFTTTTKCKRCRCWRNNRDFIKLTSCRTGYRRLKSCSKCRTRSMNDAHKNKCRHGKRKYRCMQCNTIKPVIPDTVKLDKVATVMNDLKLGYTIEDGSLVIPDVGMKIILTSLPDDYQRILATLIHYRPEISNMYLEYLNTTIINDIKP